MRRAYVSAVAALLLACLDAPTVPRNPIPKDASGILRVSVTTAGGDPDLDGYTLFVDAEHRGQLNANATMDVRVTPGTHLVTLEGIADNCAVSGSFPVSVSVADSGSVNVTLTVTCIATGILVSTRTTGSDFPPDYRVRVANGVERSVGVNGSFEVTRLVPGRYTVSLVALPSNCAVASEQSITVDVASRVVVPVAFEIACSAFTKKFAFVLDSVASGAYSRWIVVAAADGLAQTILTKGHGPDWSPDGSKLLYSNVECDYYGYTCTGGLALLDMTTGSTSTPEFGTHGSQPAFSPDGQSIVLIRWESIVVAPLDGSRIVRLSPPVSHVSEPNWSPDGLRIVFGCWSTSADICVINTDGSGFQMLTQDQAIDFSPVWSPDGSRIAFVTRRFGDGRTLDIALMNPDGTDVRRLTAGSDPRWLPDGSRLLFTGASGIFSIRPDGSDVTRLTNGRHRDPAWRP